MFFVFNWKLLCDMGNLFLWKFSIIIIVCRYKAKVAALYALPDKLKVEEDKRSEEMLSNQMLSGIPEVDLGLE